MPPPTRVEWFAHAGEMHRHRDKVGSRAQFRLPVPPATGWGARLRHLGMSGLDRDQAHLRHCARGAFRRYTGHLGTTSRRLRGLCANLGTGEVAEVDSARVLPTESAAKTFVLLHYARLVASGACDPSARVAVPDDFRFGGTGVLRYLSDGLTLASMTLLG